MGYIPGILIESEKIEEILEHVEQILEDVKEIFETVEEARGKILGLRPWRTDRKINPNEETAAVKDGMKNKIKRETTIVTIMKEISKKIEIENIHNTA